MSVAAVPAIRVGYPQRVVCLTEETTEILYRIGAGHLVVGVSGYTVRPPEARKKPRVSAFISASFEKVESLRPDLVLCFSDLQADIARELIKRGLNVLTFNQRSVEEILRTIRVVGGLVGYHAEAEQLALELSLGLEKTRDRASRFASRPKVFFEEWHEPLISGIRWVSELVGVAGGEDIFPELSLCPNAPARIVSHEEVVRRNPDVIIASWCGRKVRPEKIAARPGFSETTAVRLGRIHEIKSAFILQPGPAALTDGLAQLHRIIALAANGSGSTPGPR